MKMCERCKKVPVANSRAMYCEECKKIVKRESRARYREKQKTAQENASDPAPDVPQETTAHVSGCPGCAYYRLFYAGESACHYAIDTGNVRTLSAEECYQHEGTPYKPVKG